MTMELTTQVEQLQERLDVANAEIDRLKGVLAPLPKTDDLEDMEHEKQRLTRRLEAKAAELEETQLWAEQGKAAGIYAKEYALGAYVALQGSRGLSEIDIEASQEYVDFYRELDETEVKSGDDFLSLMRTGAGYYRRARSNRAINRQGVRTHSREVQPPDKSKRYAKSPFVGVSKMRVSV